jgi:transposase-like protein
MDLSELTKMTEAEARDFLEEIRWPAGPVCPHCGSVDESYHLEGSATRPGVWKCARCRKQYTVTVGTVMHRSHIPLRKWVIAFHLMSSSKKGISALQLQRTLGLKGYKSAWHLAHRIRAAMQEGSMGFLKGTVEVDETYVGGKPRKENKGGSETKEPKKKVKRGRGTTKTPVLALVERNGNVVAKPIEHVDAKTLKGAIKELCRKDSVIMTDEWASYTGIGKDFAGHQVVKHNDGEFVRGDAWTNSVESYFALLKRGVHGAFHHVSKKHLHRYCNEFSFRWNRRKIDDGQRMACIIQGVGGKRLTYKPLARTIVL